jgi:hypothetical protein
MTALEAGRELDALIAVRIMGYIQAPNPSVLFTPNHTDEHPEICFGPKPYSTDIAYAWQVVERMKEHAPVEFKNLSLVAYCYNRTYASFSAEAIRHGEGFEEANGEYATPLAICRAALAAVGAA